MTELLPGDRTLLHNLEPILWALNHPEVTDIVVNKPFEVLIRKAGVWQSLAVPSFDLDTLDAMTILIGQRSGREFDAARPYCNSTLPGGQRFQGVRAPGTHADRILWAIRRPPTVARKVEDPDFEDVISDVNKTDVQQRGKSLALAQAFRNKDWRAVLVGARMAGLSIGIVAAYGAGKTDLVRRFVQVHRPYIRMATLQTDDELGEAGPANKAPVFYDDTQISADEALRITKRLVPDEIVLAEVRGNDVGAMLLALNSGVTGLTTWHANEGQEFEALADMDKTQDRQVTLEKARKAFGVIAYAQRTDRRNHENDKGFRITSLRLMAAEEENV